MEDPSTIHLVNHKECIYQSIEWHSKNDGFELVHGNTDINKENSSWSKIEKHYDNDYLLVKS